MIETPVQIRNPDVVRAIRELAERTGQPITDAVGEAVRRALAQAERGRRTGYEQRLAGIRDIGRRFSELAVHGPILSDQDLYDEDGLPR